MTPDQLQCLLWWKCREYETKACLDCGHNMAKESFHAPGKTVGFLVLKGEDAQRFEGIDRPMYREK